MLILALALAAAPPKVDCRQYAGIAQRISYEPKLARQGETVRLVPMTIANLGRVPEPVPDECATDWKIEGDGVKLIRDRKTKVARVVIAPNALQRGEVKLRARIGGQEAWGGFTVIGAKEQVLSGTFHVVEEMTCFGTEAAEIVFHPTGYFTYTRAEDMYETKITGDDYYRWDAATGVIEVSHQEKPFEVWQRGTARWQDGRLVMEGFDPGGPGLPAEPLPADYPKCHLVLAGG